jgi:arylsulfatase A-like enzyme
MNLKSIFLIAAVLLASKTIIAQNNAKPNVIIIYADDVGYGDLSCYGATKINTPNIDKLAKKGIKFTNAHATSSTCTPSRYGLLTGVYPWRKKDTGIAAGNAGSIITVDQLTLGNIFQNAGYKTAVIGKWHLGLGGADGPDWNGSIKPSPNDLGFDYSFIIPATPDRVPCVYIENDRVANLDPKDPISVSYDKPIGNLPTGKAHPELLKMMFSHQHDETIINGISRIGYMTGGKTAWWNDELMGDDITNKALNYIEKNKANPFFLYFGIHDVHVPRAPHPRFVGKSGMGPRGDALLELDYNTGKIVELLDQLGLSKNTIVVFSSDNGPVLDDGYKDDAVEKLNGHTPAGEMSGGKYSKFDAGTRLPTIIKWPKGIKKNQVSGALLSQLDFFASFAKLLDQNIPKNAATDSEDMLSTFLGKSKTGRLSLVEQGLGPGLAIVKGDWKFIPPNNGAKMIRDKNMALGNDKQPQLYNLKTDIAEKTNLASQYPEIVKELTELLGDTVKKN